jgi:broad specificity phosphatase PhoE
MTPGVTRVYLARRHGQTALNAGGRLRGLSDPPLDVGVAEVARLADSLAGKGPTVVVSRPLQRTVATAGAIGSATHIPVAVDVRLTDRDHGPVPRVPGGRFSSWWPTRRWSRSADAPRAGIT